VIGLGLVVSGVGLAFFGLGLELCGLVNITANRKPVCDFLLVNNTDLYPMSHRFPVIAQ